MSVQRPKMLNERQGSTRAEKAFSAICTVLLVVLVAVALFNLWFVNNYFIVQVDGDSMNDTFLNGGLLYTRQGNGSARRGEVVIVDVKEYAAFPGTERIIKRLIAVEGDSVKWEEGVVYLKKAGGEYEPLNEPYAKGQTDYFSEVTVGEGEIFVLGDNRGNSKDSSKVGCLEFKDTIGVVPDWAIDIKDFSTWWEKDKGSFNTQ